MYGNGQETGVGKAPIHVSGKTYKPVGLSVAAARRILDYHQAPGRRSRPHQESIMGKEQRNEKMAKKPKKDSSAPKGPVTSDRPTAPMTAVLPRGKEKKKAS